MLRVPVSFWDWRPVPHKTFGDVLGERVDLYSDEMNRAWLSIKDVSVPVSQCEYTRESCARTVVFTGLAGFATRPSTTTNHALEPMYHLSAKLGDRMRMVNAVQGISLQMFSPVYFLEHDVYLHPSRYPEGFYTLLRTLRKSSSDASSFASKLAALKMPASMGYLEARNRVCHHAGFGTSAFDVWLDVIGMMHMADSMLVGAQAKIIECVVTLNEMESADRKITILKEAVAALKAENAELRQKVETEQVDEGEAAKLRAFQEKQRKARKAARARKKTHGGPKEEEEEDFNTNASEQTG